MELLNIKLKWSIIIPVGIILVGLIIYFYKAKSIEALTHQEQSDERKKKEIDDALTIINRT